MRHRCLSTAELGRKRNDGKTRGQPEQGSFRFVHFVLIAVSVWRPISLSLISPLIHVLNKRRTKLDSIELYKHRVRVESYVLCSIAIAVPRPPLHKRYHSSIV